MLIDVREAAFGYGGRPVVTVDHLALRAGRCVGIFGPNGAGKTTLVRGVTGLLAPLSGRVQRVAGGDRGGGPLRFAYMPQHRAMELQWPMTAMDAAAMATSARQALGRVGRSAAAKVLSAMRTLGVEAIADRPFAQLSGGQQQRVLLAGAMASEPAILVLDEPTDGLDVRSTQLLLELLAGLTAKGLCTLVISHEVEDLMQVCHEIAWLHAADEPGRPSRVEMIPPAAMGERMLLGRRGG